MLKKAQNTSDLTAYIVDMVPVTATSASSTADIKTWLETQPDNNVGSVSLADSGHAWQDVNVICKDTTNPCYGQEGTHLRYFASAHRLVAIGLGNAGHIPAPPDGQNFYSSDIADSIKPL